MITLLAVAAIAAEPVADSTAVLLAYGPLGVFAIIGIIAGRVIWKRFNELLTAATARAEAAEGKYEGIVTKLVDQVVPAMTRSTDSTAELLAELAEMRRERR